MGDPATIAWLLEGDPAVRWQVLRDLLDAPDDVVAEARARVATEGWGTRLLEVQDAGRDLGASPVQPEVDVHHLHAAAAQSAGAPG